MLLFITHIYQSKKYILVGLLCLTFITTFWAQTDLKIGTTPGSISPSAVFEAASTTKGMLLPRMTTAQMNLISSPANGLQIYNTDDGCIYIYRTSAWLSTCSPTYAMAWGLLGNSGTTAGVNFIGTTDAQDLVFKTNTTERMRITKTGNVGIGTSTPEGKFEVAGTSASDFIHTRYTTGAGLAPNLTLRRSYSPTIGVNGAVPDGELIARLVFKGNTGDNTTPYLPNGSVDIQVIQKGAASLTNGGADLAFSTTPQNSITPIERMRITDAGNMGIGLQTPNAPLQFATSFVNRKVVLYDVNNNDHQYYGFGANSGIMRYQIANTTNAHVFYAGSSSTISNELMRISGTGSVGINTATPQYKLDIDAQTGSTGDPLRLLGLNVGALSDSIISSNSGVLRRLSVNQVIANAWNILGNAGTVDGTNFIGTTDNKPLNVRVNNQKAGRIDNIQGTAFWGYLTGNVNTGTFNTFIGNQAGTANTTGASNTGLGYQALGTNTTADNNTAIGSEALVANSTGYANTATGRQAMRMNTTGYNNVANGTYALSQNTTGYYTTAVGWSALAANTTGGNNTGLGAQALLANTTGAENFSGGLQSLYFNTTGSYNTAVGNYSMFSNMTGNNNVSMGPFALGYNSTAWGNTAIGYRAVFSNTTGQGIVAVGDSALYNSITSSNHTVMGYRAASATTGSNITAIGYQAGLTNTTGSNNTFLGYNANVGSAALSNATAIGYNAIVGASNSLVLGGTGTDVVNVGIGITTPSATLDVQSSTALSTGVGVKFHSSTLDSVFVVSNDANFKFRNTTNDFGLDPNNFLSGHYLSSAGFRTFTPVYGRGFFGIEALIAANSLSAASNVYGGRVRLQEESGNTNAFTDSYAGIFNFNKKGGGNHTFHQNLMSNTILDGGSATITKLSGVVGQLTMSSGTTNITTANLLQANLGITAPNTYSGTITDLRGLYINYLGSARVTNAYGLYMEDVVGSTNNYAIYTNAGKVRLGGLSYTTDADAVTIDASGNLTKRSIYGVAWNLYGNSGTSPSSTFVGTTDAQDLVFRTNNTEGMRLTTNRYLGLGTTAPAYKVHIEDAGGSDADIAARIYNTNTLTFQPSLLLQTSGGTKAAPTAVANTTMLGAIRWGGYDGSTFNDIQCAEIGALATQAWTTVAHGTSLLFRTIPNGAITASPRMLIDQNGNVGIGGTTAAHLLDVQGGNIAVTNTTGTAGQVRFYEPSGSGSNYTALVAQAQVADVTYTLPAAAPTVNGQVLSATTTGTMSWTNSGATITHGVNSPASYSASQNDLALVSSGNSIYRLTSSAAINITGIAAATDGRQITLINVGGFAITLKNQVTSTAANQFLLKGLADYILVANGGAVTLIYDATSARWRDIMRN